MKMQIAKPAAYYIRLLSPVFPALILLVAVDRVDAQPTLDRVEQQIRGAAGNTAAPDGSRPAGAEPGYLGLVADDRQEQGRGIRVLDVAAGGPAAKGGLEAGDLITSINGNPVKRMDDMGRILTRLPVGSKVDFVVTRNEVDTPINVTLGRRPATDQRRPTKAGKEEETPAAETSELPDDAGGGATPTHTPRAGAGGSAASSGPKLGVRTLPITDETRARYQLPSTEGAFVAAVTIGSPAEKAGIPAGSVITALDGEKVTAPDDLAGIVKRIGVGNEVELTYLNRGQEVTTKILLAAGPAAAAPTPAAARPRTADTRPTLGPNQGTVAKPAARDSQRIAELESRVRELEERLEQLEAASRGR